MGELKLLPHSPSTFWTLANISHWLKPTRNWSQESLWCSHLYLSFPEVQSRIGKGGDYTWRGKWKISTTVNIFAEVSKIGTILQLWSLLQLFWCILRNLNSYLLLEQSFPYSCPIRLYENKKGNKILCLQLTEGKTALFCFFGFWVVFLFVSVFYRGISKALGSHACI